MAEASNPFSVLAEGAIAMHELYGSLVTAGFTEAQALTLIGTMFAKMAGG